MIKPYPKFATALRLLALLCVLLLTGGCFIDARITGESVSSNDSPDEPTVLPVTHQLRSLNSINPLSKLVTLEVEFSAQPDSFTAENIDLNGAQLMQIYGGPLIYQIEVKADDFSPFTANIKNNLKFSNTGSTMNPAEALTISPNQTKKSHLHLISSSSISYTKEPSLGSDGSVYLLGNFNSWTDNTALFGDRATYDSAGNRIGISLAPSYGGYSRGVKFTYSDGSYLFFNSSCYLERYFAGGTLDSSFIRNHFSASPGDTGVLCSFVRVNSVIRTLSGKILVAGKFAEVGGNPKTGIVRLNSDGSFDGTFVGQPLNPTEEVMQVLETSDAKLFILGDFIWFNFDAYSDFFVKTDANGNIDPTFRANQNHFGATLAQRNNSPSDIAWPNSVLRMHLTSNNKLYVMGFTDFVGGAISHGVDLYDLNGNRDLTFYSNLGSGFKKNATAHHSFYSAMQTDNKLLLSPVNMSTSDQFKLNEVPMNKLIRLNLDGTRDVSFGFNPQYLGELQVNSSNEITISTGRLSYDTKPSTSILKILPNGELASPNALPLEPIVGTLRALDIDSNGRFLLAGLTQYGAQPVGKLVRLNTDFTYDSSFDMSTGFVGTVYTISVLKNGNILVAGDMTSFKGTPIEGIAILTPQGELASGYNFTGFGSAAIYKIKALSTGDFLVFGSFTSYRGAPVAKLILLNSDLDLVEAFKPHEIAGISSDNIQDACELKDGKVVIVGSRAAYPYNGAIIARLSLNGSVDPSDIEFNSKMPTDTTALDRALLCTVTKDQSLIVNGQWTQFQGQNRIGAIRINRQGDLDTSFLANSTYPNGQISFSPGATPYGGFFSFENFSLYFSSQDFSYEASLAYRLLILSPL